MLSHSIDESCACRASGGADRRRLLTASPKRSAAAASAIAGRRGRATVTLRRMPDRQLRSGGALLLCRRERHFGADIRRRQTLTALKKLHARAHASVLTADGEARCWANLRAQVHAQAAGDSCSFLEGALLLLPHATAPAVFARVVLGLMRGRRIEGEDGRHRRRPGQLRICAPGAALSEMAEQVGGAAMHLRRGRR